MLEPYISKWAQGLSLLAQPAAAPRTLALYAQLADTIWHAAGDAATDLTWCACGGGLWNFGDGWQ